MTFADALTGGAIGGTIAAVLIALICIAAIVAGFFAHYDGWIGMWGGGIGLLITVVVYKQGDVGQISKRLVSNGDHGMYEKFVLTINGQPYGVDDTRASLVKSGDRVHLRCKRAYQFGVDRAAHGWDCRWAGVVG